MEEAFGGHEREISQRETSPRPRNRKDVVSPRRPAFEMNLGGHNRETPRPAANREDGDFPPAAAERAAIGDSVAAIYA